MGPVNDSGAKRLCSWNLCLLCMSVSVTNWPQSAAFAGVAHSAAHQIPLSCLSGGFTSLQCMVEELHRQCS